MFSRGKAPLLCEVIPIIDALQLHLDQIRDEVDKDGNPVDYPEAIRHGAARAAVVLSKYYAKTDESEVYRIAMRA